MNILFFLTPKKDIAYVNQDDTVRQAMEKMEHHRFSCVPIIDRDGCYKGCITEGDLLWGMKEMKLGYSNGTRDIEKVSVMAIRRKFDYRPIHVETDMEQLISRAMNQNFVPVVDDQDKFIGIVTRKDILQYFYNKLNQE